MSSPIEKTTSESTTQYQKNFVEIPGTPQYSESSKIYEDIFKDRYQDLGLPDDAANSFHTYSRGSLSPAYSYYGNYDNQATGTWMISSYFGYKSSSIPLLMVANAVQTQDIFDDLNMISDFKNYHSLSVSDQYGHHVTGTSIKYNNFQSNLSTVSLLSFAAGIGGRSGYPILGDIGFTTGLLTSTAKVFDGYPNHIQNLARKHIVSILDNNTTWGVYRDFEDFVDKKGIIAQLEKKAFDLNLPPQSRELYLLFAYSVLKEDANHPKAKSDDGQNLSDKNLKKVMEKKIKKGKKSQVDIKDFLMEDGENIAEKIIEEASPEIKEKLEDKLDTIENTAPNTKTILENLKDIQKAETHRQTQDKIHLASQSSHLITGFLTLIDPDDAPSYQRANLVLQSGLEIASLVNDIINKDLTGPAAISPYLSIAMVAVHLIGELEKSNQPTYEEIVLKHLESLGQQIQTLRSEMHDRFDRIEDILGMHYKSFMDQFATLRADNAITHAELRHAYSQLGDIAKKVDQIERNTQIINTEQDRIRIDSQLVPIASHVSHHLESDDFFTGYSEAELREEFIAARKAFRDLVIQHSEGEDLAGKKTQSVDEVIDKAMVFGADFYINSFANGVYGWQSDSGLANPLIWSEGLKYWIDLEAKYPQFQDRTTPLKDMSFETKNIMSQADEVDRFVHELQTNSDHFDGLIERYYNNLIQVFSLLKNRSEGLRKIDENLRLANVYYEIIQTFGNSQEKRTASPLGEQLSTWNKSKLFEINETELSNLVAKLFGLIQNMNVSLPQNSGANIAEGNKDTGALNDGRGTLFDFHDQQSGAFFKKFPDPFNINGFYKLFPPQLYLLQALGITSELKPNYRLAANSQGSHNKIALGTSFKIHVINYYGLFEVEAPISAEYQRRLGNQIILTLGARQIDIAHLGFEAVNASQIRGRNPATKLNPQQVVFHPPNHFDENSVRLSNSHQISGLAFTPKQYHPSQGSEGIEFAKRRQVSAGFQNRIDQVVSDRRKELKDQMEVVVLEEIWSSAGSKSSMEFRKNFKEAIDDLERSRNILEKYVHFAFNESFYHDPEFRSFFYGARQLWDQEILVQILTDRLESKENGGLSFSFEERFAFAKERSRHLKQSIGDKIGEIRSGERKEEYLPIKAGRDLLQTYLPP